MDTHLHHIKLCKHCGTVIQQCRCPAPDKHKTYGECGNCQLPKDMKVAQEQADVALCKYLVITNSIRQAGWNYIPTLLHHSDNKEVEFKSSKLKADE